VVLYSVFQDIPLCTEVQEFQHSAQTLKVSPLFVLLPNLLLLVYLLLVVTANANVTGYIHLKIFL